MSLDPTRSDPKREAAAAIARAQADLERAVQELGRLPAIDVQTIALAAHALTSFLTITGAVVDLLIPLVRNHPDRQVGVWLDGLAHATALMTHTVSQLMNTSVSVPYTQHIEDVDTVRLVGRACAFYQRSADQKAIMIRFAAGPGVPEIRTDRILVAATVDGLLSYAVTQSPARTVVAVEIQAERGGAALRVRDAGPGLSGEELERIFAVTAQSLAGPGHGLAVAKRFVDQLGGQISCESAPGRGTTVTVWLPRARSIE